MRPSAEAKAASTYLTPEYRLLFAASSATSEKYYLQPFVERWQAAGVKWVRIWLDNYSFVLQSGANGGAIQIGFVLNENSEREMGINLSTLYGLIAYIQPNYYLQGVSSKMDAYIDIPVASLTNFLTITMTVQGVAGVSISGYSMSLRFAPLA